jgi:hypothetical protein
MSDSNYILMIGISGLDVSLRPCRIVVTRKQTLLEIQLVENPNFPFKCSFMFFVADSYINKLEAFYHVLIDNSVPGVVDSNRQNLPLKSTNYYLPKRTNSAIMLGMAFAFV